MTPQQSLTSDDYLQIIIDQGGVDDSLAILIAKEYKKANDEYFVMMGGR